MCNWLKRYKQNIFIIIMSGFIALYLTCFINEFTLTTNLQRGFIYTYFVVMIFICSSFFLKKISKLSCGFKSNQMISILFGALVLCIISGNFLMPQIHLPNNIVISIPEESNQDSQGKEVWISGIRVGGVSKDIARYADDNSGWVYKENALYGNAVESRPLTLPFEKAQKIEISFSMHKWSGNVRIENDQFLNTFDLYDLNGSSIKVNVPVSVKNYSNWMYWGMKGGQFFSYFILLFLLFYFFKRKKKHINKKLTKETVTAYLQHARTAPQTSSPNRIDYLDGLRAMCALIVPGKHFILGEFENMGKRIRNNKKEKIYAFLCILSITAVLLCITCFYLFDNRTEVITLSGTQIHNDSALGNEVWLTSIKENGQSLDIGNLIISNNGWEQRDNAYVMTAADKGNLQLKINKKSKIVMEFTKHPWSGVVKIQDDHGIKVVDLYDPTGNTYSTVINTDYYKIRLLEMITIISSIVLLGFVFYFTRIRLWKSIKMDMILLIVLLIIARIFYLQKCTNLYSLFNDSEAYIAGGFPGLRTPMYSWIIQGCKLFLGSRYLYGVVLVQNIVGILSATVLFLSLKKHLNYKLSYFVSLYYGVLPGLVNYEFCILSDSISITLLVITTGLLLSYIKDEKLWQAILINIGAFILLLVRPTNIILGIVLVPFWILRSLKFGVIKHNNLNDKIGLIGIMFYCFGFLMYCYYSYLKIGYFQISTAGSLNLLITLIMNNLYHTNGFYDIQKIIDSTYQSGGDPWLAFGNVLDYLHNDYDTLKKYLNSCIFNNITGFISYNIGYFVDTMFLSIGSIYAKCKDRTLLFLNYLILPVPFLTVFVPILWEFIYSISVWIKQRKILWINLGLSSMGIAYLISGILGSPIEAQRHSLSVIPIFILIMALYIERIIRRISWNR